MDYQTLRYAAFDGIATITLDRPDVMNALNTQMRAEILHAVKAGARSERVVVITGSGRAFCSGQDLGAGKDAANVDLERTLRDEYVPLIEAIADCPVPTIAAVNGAAAGAGANLALACDVVIATESAYFLQAFTRIGLIPDAGGTWLLPRQMGIAKAMGAALFADRISAKQASDWGMIWEAVPDDVFVEHWKRRAAYLAKGPTLAFANVKKALRAADEARLTEQMVLEAQLQGDCGKSHDFQEGVAAFTQKRPAKFEGR
ncbi:MAG: enoyl-CoA hydratase-related protein [Pseudomonadota bacterium]